jgi:Mlc titration factor MtfA (ptsG expression regulator)
MRHRNRRHDLPAPIHDLIGARLPHWSALDGDERARLIRLATAPLHGVSWEASRGFALDDTIRATIAGHAALLGIGLPDPVFHNVHAIVVHPATITLRGQRAGPVPGTLDDRPRPVHGHTTANGPVFIAWDTARQQARHPERGHNVVFHEFAHKLDAEDGTVDGTPRIPDPAQRERWIAACDTVYRALRTGTGGTLLSDYAATSPGEFFAVATETFLDRGAELSTEHPDLYAALRDFYHQHPAGRDALLGDR